MGKMVSPIILCTIMSLLLSTGYAKKKSTSAPSPAPATDNVNLTQLLSFAGPYSIFLKNLKSTNLIPVIESQAKATGATVFAPTDDAFNSLEKHAFSNLTQAQFRNLMGFHVVRQTITLANFTNLNVSVETLAVGNDYDLRFSYDKGNVSISTGVLNASETSSVSSNPSLAVYAVDKVLLPPALFSGKKIPLAPAPAMAPELRKPKRTESPSHSPSSESPASSSMSSPADSVTPSSCNRCFGWRIGQLLILLGALVLVVY